MGTELEKIETRICPDCNEEVITLIDKTGMLIRYEKMCPCIVEILKLRNRRFDEYAIRKRLGKANAKKD